MTGSALVRALREGAESDPDAEAFTFLTFAGHEPTGRVVTRGELHQKACAVASLLVSAGATNERTLVLHAPGIDYVAAIVGSLYAGTTAVPTYPPLDEAGVERVARLSADARPVAVLTSRDLAEFMPVAALLGRPPLSAARLLFAEEVRPGGDDLAPPPSDSLALLQYTSGSTREPRGVRLTHENLMANSVVIRELFGFRGDDRGVIWLPPYHDMGLIGGILQPLVWRFPCVLMSPLDFLKSPLRWLAAITHHRGTVSGGPDFAYALCARRLSPSDVALLDLSTWRLAFTGAERIRPRTLEAFTGCIAPAGFRRSAFYPCYGLAESTLIVSGSRSRDSAPRLVAHDDRRLVSCGQPATGHHIRVVEAARHVARPDGAVGEIWVSGPSVADGYFGTEPQDDVFGCRMVPDDGNRYVRTGDLGFIEDGELVVTGRTADKLLVRGRIVYPQDLEETAETADAALRPGCGSAFMIEDDVVIVYELSETECEIPLEPVVAAIRGAVAREHGVRVARIALTRRGVIPKTSSGKIQRLRCRDLLAQGELNVLLDETASEHTVETIQGRSAPLSRLLRSSDPEFRQQLIERWLVQELEQRFPDRAADVSRPIVDYGLDSLGATELAHAAQTELGVNLAPERLIDGVTPTALATALAADGCGEAAEPLEPPLRRLDRPAGWPS